MALSDLDVKAVYQGNGSDTTFPIVFDYTNASEVKVTLRDETSSTVVETPWTSPTNYSIVGANIEAVTAPSATQRLLVARVNTLNQPYNPIGSGELDVEAMEEQLDAIVRQIQELDEKIGRCLKLPKTYPTSLVTDLFFPEPAASASVRWNTGKTALENITVASDSIANPLTVKGDLLVHNGSTSTKLGVGANHAMIVADSAEATGIKYVAGNTTKGDVLAHNGTDATRLPVGTNGQMIVADSAQATGLKYISGNTTKGDVLSHNGTDQIRLPVGTNGQVLLADSAQAAGIKWGAAQAEIGHTANLKIVNATTTNTDDSIQLTSGDGTPLSASVVGRVILPSTTQGERTIGEITADVKLNLTGCHWGFGTKGDVTDALLYFYIINDAGVIKYGVSIRPNLDVILGANDETTQTSVTTVDKVLVNSALTGDSRCVNAGWFKANFDDTSGAAEDLWAVQSGIGDFGMGVFRDREAHRIRGTGDFGIGAGSHDLFMATTEYNEGGAISATNSDAAGFNVKFLRPGVAHCSLSVISAATTTYFGWVRNSSNKSASITTLSDASILAIALSGSASDTVNVSCSVRVVPGDEISAQESDSETSSGNNNQSMTVNFIPDGYDG